MKRTISLLLVFVMVLSMMACGQNNEPPADRIQSGDPDASNGDYIVALTARFDRLVTEFERVK